MLRYFQQNLSIKHKLLVSFAIQSSLVAACGAFLVLVHMGSLTPEQGLPLAVAAVLVSVAAGAGLGRAMVHPYVTTVQRMEGLAAGDLTSPIDFTAYTDCVGRMTKAMFAFRENARDKIKADADAIEERHRREVERRQAEDAAATKERTLVVGSIGAGLERLAAGDLTFRLSASLPDVYERLRADFNTALGRLQDTLRTAATAARAINAGTNEISAAAEDLSHRTEQQAANLEETAASLDQITATVRKTAEGSKQAQAVVSSAKADAEHSGEIVRQAVAAMTAIETSSKQVSQIIGVIDEIAFQTNLLALNAGVEAARAGEAGRGFAVVASEVRGLAQRSAESAKEIKRLISASNQQVAGGVDLVRETGKALERIVTRVGEINILVSEIATSTHEQAGALQQVNTAIGHMDQATQQNAAMVEQSTAASLSLKSETEELRRLIAAFILGDDAPAADVPKALIAVKPARPVARPSAKPVPARKTVGRGGAALKVEPAASEEWSEF